VPVVIATDDARYVLIGITNGRETFALASDVARGPKYATRYSWTREEIEADDDGPIVTEFEIEVAA
jgi:hypothetical protein